MKDNQYALNPILHPANTGLTTICDYSGDTADTVVNFKDGERLVATSFISKYNAFEAANARLKRSIWQPKISNGYFHLSLMS